MKYVLLLLLLILFISFNYYVIIKENKKVHVLRDSLVNCSSNLENYTSYYLNCYKVNNKYYLS